MIKFIFSENSKKIFSNLEKDLQNRILTKLGILKTHPDIFSVLMQMKDCDSVTHRLRIGNYRLILRINEQDKNNLEFIVVDIGHRREIYK